MMNTPAVDYLDLSLLYNKSTSDLHFNQPLQSELWAAAPM